MICATPVLIAGCDNTAVTDDAAPLEDVAPRVAEDAFGEALEKNQTPDGAYIVVEEMPTLVGGLAAVQDAVVYPASSRDAGVEGRVYVAFIVDVEGKPTDIQVQRSPDEALGQAAVDAVEQQRFTPGRQDGVPVPVHLALPITFKLQE